MLCWKKAFNNCIDDFLTVLFVRAKIKKTDNQKIIATSLLPKKLNIFDFVFVLMACIISSGSTHKLYSLIQTIFYVLYLVKQF